MSHLSLDSHRDIRSTSKGYKRDKDHAEKWSMGVRPSSGVVVNFAHTSLPESDPDFFQGGSESQRAKVRPIKQWSQMITDHKSHANITPKPTSHIHYDTYGNGGRMARKVDAAIEANDHTSSPLSKSLLDLLPTHTNNTSSAIHTAIRASSDDILYSYDNKGKSPGQKGREVGLEGLVEQAEKKFLAKQTERIVKGEYEVIDGEGESTVLSQKKGKKSPKQKALKTESSVVASALEDDDGFELL